MNGGMKNINVPVQYQKGLAGHDKLRGHGRPVRMSVRALRV